MRTRFKLSKKTIRISLICFCIGIIVGVFVFMRNSMVSGESSVCKTSHYSLVQVGMTKQQVVELWGEPSMKRVKDNVGQNFFYQGGSETEIKEGWTYRNGQPDSAEIYFDSSGLVNGKNCGQG